MDNYAKSILRKKISRLVKRGLLDDKKVVLFGASVFSKEIKNCLSDYNIPVNAIVDNDTRKIGKVCMGLTVQKPEVFFNPLDENYAILILSYGFYREMAHQLKTLGHAKKNIFILNLKVNESLPIFAYMAAKTIRGLATHKKLTKDLSQNGTLFIAPYTGVGDIYLVGLFFNEYIKRNNVKDYAFVVVSGACKKVAEMFGIKNIIVVKKSTVTDDMINAHMFFRTNWSMIVLNDGWLGELTQWIRGYKGLDFEKMFRYFVFGFDDSVPHELPPKKDFSHETDVLFQKYNLIKGKTVVFSPYSNTLFDLPDDIMESIVSYFREQGLTVCTNCAGTEKPVAGTEAVFFPLNMAVDFMDAAGYFIGVRSGLCDVISSSVCKKVILYEKDGLFYRSSQLEYFSLKKMGLCDDAAEIEYHDNLKEDVLSEIFSVIN